MTATAESRVVLNPSAGTAGASHSPPDRCAATSWAVTAASPGTGSQTRGHRLQRRQAVPARRPRRDQHPARRSRQRQHARQLFPQRAGPRSEPRPPRPRRRRRHQPPPSPGTASHGRAAARPAAAACAASTSTAMITAAPYRRRDHRSAGSSTCVRPHPRHLARRGQNSSTPENTAISRRRAAPTAPAARRSTGSAAPPPPAATRHCPQNLVPSPQVPPPAPPGGSPRSPGQEITGRAAATAYMATVTPSTTPASRKPPG